MSSRSLHAGSSREDHQMRQRRPRRQLHDPAWNGQDFSRRHHASGDRPTCVRGDQRRRQGCGEPGAGLSKPHGCKTKRPFRSHRSTFWLRAPHRTHQPKIEISIASAWGPRVPSSGTFVRLPAPETLHVSRLSGSGPQGRNSGHRALPPGRQSGMRCAVEQAPA